MKLVLFPMCFYILFDDAVWITSCRPRAPKWRVIHTWGPLSCKRSGFSWVISPLNQSLEILVALKSQESFVTCHLSVVWSPWCLIGGVPLYPNHDIWISLEAQLIFVYRFNDDRNSWNQYWDLGLMVLQYTMFINHWLEANIYVCVCGVVWCGVVWCGVVWCVCMCVCVHACAINDIFRWLHRPLCWNEIQRLSCNMWKTAHFNEMIMRSALCIKGLWLWL